MFFVYSQFIKYLSFLRSPYGCGGVLQIRKSIQLPTGEERIFPALQGMIQSGLIYYYFSSVK